MARQAARTGLSMGQMRQGTYMNAALVHVHRSLVLSCTIAKPAVLVSNCKQTCLISTLGCFGAC